MFRSTLPLATALLALSAAGALAQAVGSNSVWIGQVGTENQLQAIQEGRGNEAGADAVWLRLGQDGGQNVMSIEQSGYANRLATWFEFEPRFARGAWQRGNGNRITVQQSNGSAVAGSNSIGAIQQWSSLTPGRNEHNSLRITQSAAPEGAGQHVVGRVVQVARDGSNSAEITQSGGGPGAGNVLANLNQSGAGNSFTLTQSGERNRLGLAVSAAALPIDGAQQRGEGHVAFVSQGGSDNLLGGIWQTGANNQLRVEVEGQGNEITRIYQDTESWNSAATGNTLVATIIGSGNGQDAGQPVLAVPAVWSELLQYGDQNDLRLTITRGVDSRFALTQDGDDNRATLTIGTVNGSDSHRNSSAVHQLGDSNTVHHHVTGNDNSGVIAQRGAANSVTLLQSGDFSRALVTITGTGNGTAAPPFGAALHGPAATLAASGALSPGLIRQSGTGSSAATAQQVTLVITGEHNAFGIAQSGQANSVLATITGDANALAVLQSGAEQLSVSVQQGTRNNLAVHQF